MTVDYSKIFKIASDGVYFDGGIFYFNQLVKDGEGFSGEELYVDGEACIRFFAVEETRIIFPVSAFGSGSFGVKNAISKCKSCSLFLSEVGVKIKPLV